MPAIEPKERRPERRFRRQIDRMARRRFEPVPRARPPGERVADIVDFSNIRLDLPAMELFNPPADFARYASPAALINELMIRESSLKKGPSPIPAPEQPANWHQPAAGRQMTGNYILRLCSQLPPAHNAKSGWFAAPSHSAPARPNNRLPASRGASCGSSSYWSLPAASASSLAGQDRQGRRQPGQTRGPLRSHHTREGHAERGVHVS